MTGSCHLCANPQDGSVPLVGLTLESLDGQVRTWLICPVCHLAILNAMQRRNQTLSVVQS